MENVQLIIAESDREKDILKDEKKSLILQIQDLEIKIEKKGIRDEKLYLDMEDEILDVKQGVLKHEYDRVDQENEICKLKVELQNAYEDISSFGDVDALKRDLQAKDEKISMLYQQLTESYSDFELLSLDWDKLNEIVITNQSILEKSGDEKSRNRSNGTETLKRQRDRYKKRVDTYKERHKEDISKIREMVKKCEERERECIEIAKKLDQFENGVYGLTDAVREIKTLKLQKSIRDKEIANLTLKINDFQLQLGDFLEENEELRRRMGVKEKTKLDISNLRIQKNVELERAKSLSEALQKEVDKLEEERLQLKSQLRHVALQKGEKAVEFGLTADEFMAVEDYAESLRMGVSEVK
ncbi:hypothetical protein HK096_009659, partial [Nowakowskiella sp. JEL0078]